MSGQADTTIQVDARSLRETVDALRKLEPDVLKEMGKDLRRLAGELRSAAESKYRSHGGTTPAKGNGYSARVNLGKRKVSVAVMAKTKEAAIFELAESAHSGQGAALISMLNSEYGSPGRILWEAYDQRKAEIQARAAAAIARAEAEANRRLMGGAA